MEAIGSPGSVDPKKKTARNAMSAPTMRRQPQPVIPSWLRPGSVGA